MAMNIHGQWHQPLDLIPTDDNGYRFRADDASKIPDTPGVYVFGRRYDDKYHPLYIGKTRTLHTRICKQHFDSRKFMAALRSFPAGERFVMFCTFSGGRNQRIGKVIDVAERGLIDKALSEGNNLINIQGVRTPKHTFNFSGNRASEQIAGREMYVRETGWFG